MAVTNTLYVTEPGTMVHKVDERLVLRRESKVIADVPMLHLKQVALVGQGVEISTEAMLALVERQIDLCFFSRTMRFRARVGGEVSLFGQLRFLQARFIDNPGQQLAVARSIVRGKLINQRRLLLRHYPEPSPPLKQMAKIIEGLPAVQDLDVLRGYEGQGAALYFGGLRGLIRGVREWGFTKREYYPPPDPINTLLSFGYSLLTREVLAATYLVGFDPYLGFFHMLDYGRPSLALDLVEEFRPIIVDSLVLDLLNHQHLTLADFEQNSKTLPAADGGEPESAKGGVRLKAAARSRFLEAYEQRMSERVLYEPLNTQQTYHKVIEAQARQVARLVLGEIKQYQPFIVR
ncbi:MAG: CRISPR-associated endonuclease Cas1 [Chloroflexi bacterium]|nr:CRISPR-associated endonuclease Cas1 [Chloroflexota bacterium]